MSDSPAFQVFLRTCALSKFSAKVNEDVHDWLLKVDRYFELMKLPSADRVIAAKLLLDGLSAKWAIHAPTAPKGRDPWEHFCSILCERFQSRNGKPFARQKLITSSRTSPSPGTTTSSRPSAPSWMTLVRLKRLTVTSWASTQKSVNTLPETPPFVRCSRP